MVVDNRVYHGVGHGEPVKRQEDVLNVGHFHDFRIMIYINEVTVIW